MATFFFLLIIERGRQDLLNLNRNGLKIIPNIFYLDVFFLEYLNLNMSCMASLSKYQQ